jgi:hypothetical protein
MDLNGSDSKSNPLRLFFPPTSPLLFLSRVHARVCVGFPRLSPPRPPAPPPVFAAGHLLVAGQVVAVAGLFTVDRRRRRSWLPRQLSSLSLFSRCRLPSVRRRLHPRRPPSSCRPPSSLAGVVVAGGAAPNRSRAVQLLAPDLIVAGVLYSTSTAAATAVFLVSRSGRRH